MSVKGSAQSNELIMIGTWEWCRFRPGWARIISGEQEGIYGWIALNYLTGYLSPHPFTASRAASMETDAESAMDSLDKGSVVQAASEGLKTLGALDLGGSSLEVTFIPGGKSHSENFNGMSSLPCE